MLVIVATSCISIRNTIKNIDNNAPDLVLKPTDVFEIKTVATNKKYGYHKDYPINIFFVSTANDTLNQPRYLRALAGPNGEKLSFRKIESCCPFTSKRVASGGGMLDLYEVSWRGNPKPLRLYLNIYEKGIVMAPVGLTIRP